MYYYPFRLSLHEINIQCCCHFGLNQSQGGRRKTLIDMGIVLFSLKCTFINWKYIRKKRWNWGRQFHSTLPPKKTNKTLSSGVSNKQSDIIMLPGTWQTQVQVYIMPVYTLSCSGYRPEQREGSNGSCKFPFPHNKRLPADGCSSFLKINIDIQ